MSRRGHRVVLISSTLPGEASSHEAADLARTLTAHDWAEPFHVACSPRPNRLLALSRQRRVPGLVRRAISLWSLILGEGPWHDWVMGSRPYGDSLAQHFRPDLVWVNFGSVSDLRLGQGLARRARCAWVADVKDNVHRFLPGLTRPLLARRFVDVAGVTTNARFHGEKAQALFALPFEVIYSGVDERLVEASKRPVPADRFRIMLAGSIYSPSLLAKYAKGVSLFVARLSLEQRASVQVCYAGHEGNAVAQVFARVAPHIGIDLSGYLPLPELFHRYALSAVNSYIWSGATFHHKAVEMLAADRPVISFPNEFSETKRIAERMGAELLTPDCSEDFANVLSNIYSRWRDGRIGTSLVNYRELTWDAEADKLEAAFENTLRTRFIAFSRPIPQTCPK